MSDIAFLETATLGGGCFWCLDAVFRELDGVDEVISGYMGGDASDADYRSVCQGTTGHAEVVQMRYRPEVVDFETLLKVFWTVHDPTTLNRQGADKGPQYRSVVFYHNETQHRATLQSIAGVGSDLWGQSIVTQVVPAMTFYPAELYHQDYYQRNPIQGYCRVVIEPKVAKFRKEFLQKLKK